MLHGLLAEPTDVAFLASVLETIYARQEITRQADREKCARELVALFASGVTDRRDLLRLMGVVN